MFCWESAARTDLPSPQVIAPSISCSFATVAALTHDTTLHQCINSQEGTVNIEVIRSKLAWLGIGFGSDATTRHSKEESPFVVGLPDANMVRIMNSGGQGGAHGIVQDGLRANMRNARIAQNSTHTILSVVLEPRRISNVEKSSARRHITRLDRIFVVSGFDNNFGIQEFLLPHPLESLVIGFLEEDQGTSTLPSSRLLQDEEEATNGENNEPTQEPTEEPDEEPPHKGIWMTHAILMTLSWGLFVPLAVGSSIIRNLFPDGIWIHIHRTLNSLSLFFSILGVGLAIFAVRDEKGSKHSPDKEIEFILDESHRAVGAIVVVLCFIQALTGFVRPQASEEVPELIVDEPQDDENNGGGASDDNNGGASSDDNNGEDASTVPPIRGGSSTVRGGSSIVRGGSSTVRGGASTVRGDASTVRRGASTVRGGASTVRSSRGTQRPIVADRTSRRKVWELQHRLLGIGLIAGAWYNIHRGISLYEDRYGNLLQDDERSTTEIFWGGIIGLVVSFFVLATCARVLS